MIPLAAEAGVDGFSGKPLRFEKALIASGSGSVVPGIPGLASARYLTNETVFELTEHPRRLRSDQFTQWLLTAVPRAVEVRLDPCAVAIKTSYGATCARSLARRSRQISCSSI